MAVVLGLNISTVTGLGEVGQNIVFNLAKALERFDANLRLEYHLSSREIVILHSKNLDISVLQGMINKNGPYDAWNPCIRYPDEGINKRIYFKPIWVKPDSRGWEISLR